jgi:hypothetical protein
VRAWLAANLDRLRFQGLGQIVAQLRGAVPEAANRSSAELEGLVMACARESGYTILPGGLGPSNAGPSIAIPEAVKSAFSIATDGVTLKPFPNGRLNISVSGATAALVGGSKLSVGWGADSVGLEIPVQGFHFGGKLSKDAWEVTLSLPGETAVPNLAKLAEVFSQAEAALQRIARATGALPDLSDTAAVRAAVGPNIAPVKEAVEALKAIAEAPTRLSAGISVTGPMAGGESAASQNNTTPQGVTISATITLRF